MLMETVRGLAGGGLPPGVAAPPLAGTFADAGADRGAWSPARLALSDRLWGAGFQYPGGEGEILRLARPIGVASSANLFVVGAGGGGAACSIATRFGVRVTGFESDPDLAMLAVERCARARPAGRVQAESWYPGTPGFGARSFHHGLALEPLRDGRPEPVLAALADALRPAGRLMIVQTTADEPLDPGDPAVAAWGRCDKWSATPPSEVAVTRMLGRLGFDVRIAEDITARYVRLVMLGWKHALAGLRERPSPTEAAVLVAEAELWMLRLRLLQEERLRMVLWHAHSGRAAASA